MAAAQLNTRALSGDTRLAVPSSRNVPRNFCASQRQLSKLLPLTVIASLTRQAEDYARNTFDEDSNLNMKFSKPPKPVPRSTLRMGLPSKGRMAEDTLQLLKDSALSVYKPNPRQYVANIPQIPKLEVWFQRASDVVRKLRYGDLDLGIVGTDMFMEIAGNDPDLIIIHDALSFGQCHLALGVPMTGKYSNINSLDELRAMPDWTDETPLRVVTGYHTIAQRFFSEKQFKHVTLLSADGALEAVPAMGSADIILDLVSTGVTLRENNLKEIEGGRIMDSQGILVGSRKSLLERPGLLAIVHELVERFDAHLKAEGFYNVIANMRGDSPEDVANMLMDCPGLQGLQGPTISTVYARSEDKRTIEHGFYAASICVSKKQLYNSVKQLQKMGGSDVLVLPMTYIFDEEPARWTALLETLGLTEADVHSELNGNGNGNGKTRT